MPKSEFAAAIETRFRFARLHRMSDICLTEAIRRFTDRLPPESRLGCGASFNTARSPRMARTVKFVVVGSFAALITELIFNIFISGDYGNFVFTLFFYPVYLTLVALLQRAMLHYVKTPNALFIAAYLVFGVIGMAIEWFFIGNSPWGNPDAFQSGQWSFWTALAVVPILYLDGDSRIRRALYYYTAVYAGVAALVIILLPPQFRIVLTLWMTVCYAALHPLYFWQLFRPWGDASTAY
jgi:hypothetical protein